ncbi:MAG TPA: transporter [Janthinobacterium sp.]|nr:transporter [Janthinobacterium sp.]
MKRLHALYSFSSAIVLLGLVACASSPMHEGSGEYVDDTVITTRVKAALFNDPALKSREINVETFKGKVQLSGFVSSRDEIEKAVSVAKEVKGVNEVDNAMVVK